MEPDEMNLLNRDEFKIRMSDSFPSIYLTVISIIQGVALGILASQMDKLIFHPVMGDTIFRHWGFAIPYCLFSFSTILIVAYQYAWFIGLFKWSPTFQDIFFPFTLGLSQIIPMFFLDHPSAWMLSTSIFSFIGVFAWRNTLRHCTPIIFGDKYEAMISTKRVLIQNIKIGLLIGFSLGFLSVLTFFLETDLTRKSKFLWYSEIPIFLLFPVCAFFIFEKGEKFMQRLHRYFDYKYDSQSKYRFPIIDLLFKTSSTIIKESDRQEKNEIQGQK